MSARMEPTLLALRVDHLVYVTPDLNQGIDEIESLTGIRASPGGPHPGRGTRNALVALGPTSYLKIMAPDPEQPEPSEPRPFGMDLRDKVPRLAGWFIKGRNLQQMRERAVRNGVPLGEIKSGNRQRPDGVQLSW
ncbi:MAG: VOC family protein [Stellaceae bacterium]